MSRVQKRITKETYKILPSPYDKVLHTLQSLKKEKIPLEEAKIVLWCAPGIHFWNPVTIEEVARTLSKLTKKAIEFDEKNKEIIVKIL
jgi:hypothetical protein